MSSPELLLPQIVFYRDDINHPVVSGNKLHKLAPQLQQARELGCETILSFGGPYSNHLHALAWACEDAGLNSVGIVRGELHEVLTPTLQDCQTWGMRLMPMSRQQYRRIQTAVFKEDTAGLLQDVVPELSEYAQKNTLMVPEGGSNRLAINSLAEAYRPIFKQAQYQDVTHAVCATGTGATVAGLYRAAPNRVKVIGIQAVAEGNATIERIRSWLSGDMSDLSIVPGHCGGFAKTPNQLLEFIQLFEAKFNIPLDPIYNGKTLFKLSQMAKEDYFSEHEKVLVIHTGGLQGKR